MSIRTRRILCASMTLLSLLIVAAVYSRLPDQIPSHWDFNGQVSYDHKSTLWVLAGMQLLFNGMFEVIPHIDPRKKNYQKFIRQYNGFCVFLNLFLMVFLIAMILQAFRPGAFSMLRFVWFMVGLLFLFIGNMMPKFKPTFYNGIRTPWALSDDENWRKTHRLGGKLFFLSGLVWILGSALDFGQTFMLFSGIGSIFAATIIPYGMSWFWWKQSQ